MGKKGSSSAVRIDSKDIRSLIKQSGIKQKDLAYLIGYTPEGFSRSLRLGKMERFEDVEKIAEMMILMIHIRFITIMPATLTI